MYKRRTPVLLLIARYSGLLEEGNYILCILNNARKNFANQERKESFLGRFCYEVNLHSDIEKLARRQGYGKGDGPGGSSCPGFLYCFFIMIICYTVFNYV